MTCVVSPMPGKKGGSLLQGNSAYSLVKHVSPSRDGHGTLILRHGPDVLGQIVFKSCSEQVRAIVEFVAADRADQYFKAHSH